LVFQPANKSRDQPSDQTGSCLQSLTPVVNQRSGVPERGAKLQSEPDAILVSYAPFEPFSKAFFKKPFAQAAGFVRRLVVCLAGNNEHSAPSDGEVRRNAQIKTNQKRGACFNRI